MSSAGRYVGLTLILSLLSWMSVAQVVQSQLLRAQKEHIPFRSAVPSLVRSLIPLVALTVPEIIIGEVSLSFVGLGIAPPAVSWGALLHELPRVPAGEAPWLLTPGVVLAITAAAFYLLGEGLRGAMAAGNN
jgi:peptide/nickel transport system permease protein